MATAPNPLPEEPSRKICELLMIYRTKPTLESRLATSIIGMNTGTRSRGVFYVEAALAGCIALMACITLIIRAHKRCLWFMRRLKKNNGTYFSPHVGSTFALASILGALGVGLIIFYEMEFWEGRLLPNPILVQTLIWYPLWTGGFCVVWGAVIATLGISQNQEQNIPQTRGRFGSLLRFPLFANALMIFLPVAVTVTIFTTFIIANEHAHASQHSIVEMFEEIGKLPSTTNCTSTGVLTSVPTLNLAQLLKLMQKSTELEHTFRSFMRLGFAFWAVANVINLVIWAPCFFGQVQILKAQVAREKALRVQRHQLQSNSQPMSKPDFVATMPQYYSDQISAGSRAGNSPQPRSPSETTMIVTTSSTGMMDLRSAYQALLINSFLFALMTGAFSFLSVWCVIYPNVVLHGGKSRIQFTTSLVSFFVVTGTIVNIGLLRQAIHAPSAHRSNVFPKVSILPQTHVSSRTDAPKITKSGAIILRGESFGQEF
ncbi:hypothetical protein CROQUDRAFT_666050 [Cronartium quercuum f. sp. fusiforme G11]|uniref:Uncharacterized protein n=1 Tax=Cronartium quercuum f. sp. fusiforme G11 TaxID=708437 RepID=A0A9P6T5I9_9BASI|nr:hypothetical protein CROQUDRAFT_666050 [Cronartium quercuum f. sp. fusiforme G11]